MSGKTILLIGGEAHLRRERIEENCNMYIHALRPETAHLQVADCIPEKPITMQEQTYKAITNRIFVYSKMPKEEIEKMIERSFGLEDE